MIHVYSVRFLNIYALKRQRILFIFLFFLIQDLKATLQAKRKQTKKLNRYLNPMANKHFGETSVAILGILLLMQCCFCKSEHCLDSFIQDYFASSTECIKASPYAKPFCKRGLEVLGSIADSLKREAAYSSPK